MLKRLAHTAFCALLLSQSAPAALLVYEGYNGYASGTLSGKTPNINTIGLDQATAYDGNGPQHYTLQPSSIAFSPNLLTSGGSVSFNGSSAVAAALMDLTAAHQGTLWSSHLVNITAFGGASGNGVQTRIATDITTGGNRFISSADNRSGVSTTLGIGYNATSTSGTTSLATNTSYLLISRFTNVGETLNAGNPGVATIYALTAAQYDSFLLGGASETYLDTTATGLGDTNITARFDSSPAIVSGSQVFQDAMYMHLVSVGSTGFFDEIRYGSSLADVTPIPEPGTLLGLTAAAIVFGVWRGRRNTA